MRMSSFMEIIRAAVLIMAAVGIVPQLSAQCTPQFNISVYSDGASSTDGSTIYGYSSTDDNSILCTCVHSNYETTAAVQLADGSYVTNTEAGETASVSSATDGDGSYYAVGAASADCSCVGTVGGGGPSTAISPPPPEITGIADTTTWSNTIYQGDSGYLAIFGTALTAWGQTPSPTVTGDGDVSVSLYWASDGQVNVNYSVAAQAATGQHSIALQTAQGTARGNVNVAACTGQTPIIAEYTSYGVTDITTGQAFVPMCAWFTQTAHSAYFTFSELTVYETVAWDLIKNPLTVSQTTNYGLDDWRNLLGGPQIVNSGDRDPAHNASVKGASNSRHMFGDAIDLRNQAGTYAEYVTKACYASASYSNTYYSLNCTNSSDAGAGFVEPWTGPCANGCVHADWRNKDYNVYSQ